MAQSQKQSSCLMAYKHTVSWHVCSSADKHMAGSTERLLSHRNRWTGGLGSRLFFIPFIPLSYQLSLGAPQHLSFSLTGHSTRQNLGQKCVKVARLNRRDDQSRPQQNQQQIKWIKIVARTYLWSRRIGISELWIWHGREVPQYPEIRRDWRSQLSQAAALFDCTNWLVSTGSQDAYRAKQGSMFNLCKLPSTQTPSNGEKMK